MRQLAVRASSGRWFCSVVCSTRSPVERPIQTQRGSGTRRMERSRSYYRSDWLSLPSLLNGVGLECPSSARSSPCRAGLVRQKLLRIKRLLFTPHVIDRAGGLGSENAQGFGFAAALVRLALYPALGRF